MFACLFRSDVKSTNPLQPVSQDVCRKMIYPKQAVLSKKNIDWTPSEIPET